MLGMHKGNVSMILNLPKVILQCKSGKCSSFVVISYCDQTSIHWVSKSVVLLDVPLLPWKVVILWPSQLGQNNLYMLIVCVLCNNEAFPSAIPWKYILMGHICVETLCSHFGQKPFRPLYFWWMFPVFWRPKAFRSGKIVTPRYCPKPPT